MLVVDARAACVAIAGVDTSRGRPRIAALVSRRGHVVDSDAETVCALEAAQSGSDVLTHCRWMEILGRESVSRSFFRILEQLVVRLAASLTPLPRESDSRDLALLYVSRLLFLSFLETKGWLDRDHRFLENRFADCMVTGGGYHRRVLAPLFFGTLNTSPRNRASTARAFGRIPFLNGGLFARSALEQTLRHSHFPDEELGELFGELLSRYRFTAREDTATWSEVAIDPEMLGKAFECLMSSSARKRSGAFYTPQSLVVQVARAGLDEALGADRLESIDSLRVLDPACGSGAFLVHVLEELSLLRARLGDERPPHRIRREILTTSIFGVDINPTAVWLCELRLWLSMAIEDPEPDPMRVMPLPNLDRNIRVGDSLSGDDFIGAAASPPVPQVARLRLRYARATGPRKRSLARALDSAERKCALAQLTAQIGASRTERREALVLARSRDLFGKRPHPSMNARQRLDELRTRLRKAAQTLRLLESGGALPFSFRSGFADVAALGGFDVIIGNPPWIRTHNLDSSSRASLRARYFVYRNSAWISGSKAAAAGRGFASQVDAAALFVERSVRLLRPGGRSALIVPAKLWTSLAGGGVRDFLTRYATVTGLHDLGSGDRTFDAATYPSVLVARAGPAEASSIDVVAHRGGQLCKWRSSSWRLMYDDSPGSPWLIVPPRVRRAFDVLASAGKRMGETLIGRPILGVKTGCNDAFIVSETDGSPDSALAAVSGRGRQALIERQMLRPVIKGEQITEWSIPPGNARIIWTHDVRGLPIDSLPQSVMRWLAPWRRTLEARSDARGSRRWWSVFRIESADSSRPRVVWADIARSPRAAVIAAKDPSIVLNTCYVVRCPVIDDAHALAAILNSAITAAWLDVIAEPARGGYRRYMGWTMAMFPIPRDWRRAVSLLAPIGGAATGGAPPAAHELDDAVLQAYGLTRSSVCDLIAWRG